MFFTNNTENSQWSTTGSTEVQILLYKLFTNNNEKVYIEAGKFAEDKKLCSKVITKADCKELKKGLTNAEQPDSKTSCITHA